jgi:hypothetical protein
MCDLFADHVRLETAKRQAGADSSPYKIWNSFVRRNVSLWEE